MISLCPIARKTDDIQFAESCMVTLNFFSTSNTSKHFYFSLDESDQPTVLFDGIEKMLSNIRVDNWEQRKVYYKVTDPKAIKLFASTEHVTTDFYIAATLVTENDYIRGSVYPTYRQERTDGSENLRYTVLGSTGTSVLTFS